MLLFIYQFGAGKGWNPAITSVKTLSEIRNIGSFQI
jgi:hypothetical protein